MLRILTIVVFLLPMQSFSEAVKYSEPEQAVVEQQQAIINDSMDQVDKIMSDGTLNDVLNKERKKLSQMSAAPGLNIQMPAFLEEARKDRYLSKALSAGMSVNNVEPATMDNQFPVVLISLSMPKGQIKNLIDEASHIGAGVVVSGIIDNDFQKTLIKLKQLAEGRDGGILIDPTLFRRFEVTAVPTFILPLEPLQQCTEAGCVIPKHVKATGSASFQYFFDLVSRIGDEDEKAEADKWLGKYGSK